jgi:hypothetical protein
LEAKSETVDRVISTAFVATLAILTTLCTVIVTLALS